MLKLSARNSKRFRLRALASATLLVPVLVGSVFFAGLVFADHLDEEIQELRQQNAASQQQLSALNARASSYQEAIRELEHQIAGLQASIVANQQASDQLEQEIKAKEAELAHQRKVLGQSIKAMYLEGQISTLEILAASKDISEFVNKEVSRIAVQNKIKVTVQQIAELKLQLEQKQQELKARIADMQNQQNQLNASRAEQASLLAYTEGQKATYSQQIRANNTKIADLQRQQILENIRRFGGGGGQLGGGGYPWGYAPCLRTGQVDGACSGFEWGYNGNWRNWATGGWAYRNCTDWVAWRAQTAGVYIPSGLGNAKYWAGNAGARGYTVKSRISADEWRAGIAAVYTGGFYGHVMYVESVNDNGTITVSDYNRLGTGKYDVNSISQSGLSFVFF